MEDDGRIPNHWKLPLLIYKDVLDNDDDAVEILNSNNWSGEWLGSVHPYHHYHSNTHEVLAVHSGTAALQLGEIGRASCRERAEVVVGGGHGKQTKGNRGGHEC